MRSICVFCGASTGSNPVYTEAAETLGRMLAQQDIELVWGAGNVGLMGRLADSAIAAGGRVYGIIPSFMVKRELAHRSATEVVVVGTMHARKAAMAKRADGFIALPGGFGTLDELFEITTWAQLHIHKKPIGLLNVRGFYDPLLTMAQHMSAEGFVKPHHLKLLHVADNPADLLETMRTHVAPEGDWLEQKLL